MIDFLLLTANIPFSVAIMLMLGIALIEGLGLGFSNLLDSFFPDVDIDVDLPEGQTLPLFSQFCAWLRIGHVPLLVILIVFLTVFGLSGYIIQAIVKSISNGFLLWYIAIWPALLVSLPLTRSCAGVFALIIPKDETSAISKQAFIGKIATITLGTAKIGEPAEAKFKDKHNQTHYVMVEPLNEGEELKQGEKILIIQQQGNVFKATKETELID